MCAMHPMTSNIGDLKKWVPLSFVIYFLKDTFFTGNMLFSVATSTDMHH